MLKHVLQFLTQLVTLPISPVLGLVRAVWHDTLKIQVAANREFELMGVAISSIFNLTQLLYQSQVVLR